MMVANSSDLRTNRVLPVEQMFHAPAQREKTGGVFGLTQTPSNKRGIGGKQVCTTVVPIGLKLPPEIPHPSDPCGYKSLNIYHKLYHSVP